MRDHFWKGTRSLISVRDRAPRSFLPKKLSITGFEKIIEKVRDRIFKAVSGCHAIAVFNPSRDRVNEEYYIDPVRDHFEEGRDRGTRAKWVETLAKIEFEEVLKKVRDRGISNWSLVIGNCLDRIKH